MEYGGLFGSVHPAGEGMLHPHGTHERQKSPRDCVSLTPWDYMMALGYFRRPPSQTPPFADHSKGDDEGEVSHAVPYLQEEVEFGVTARINGHFEQGKEYIYRGQNDTMSLK